MRITQTDIIPGRVLRVDGPDVFLAQGRKLLRSRDAGDSWTVRAELPTEGNRERLAGHRLGRRLGRVGFHHFAPTGDDSAVVIAHQHIFRMDPQRKHLKRLVRLEGSRPLALCRHGSHLYYGEYRGNAERAPVRVWAASIDQPSEWVAVWSFQDVRHVHGVFFDPYYPSYWVTTGDEDSESAVWKSTDSFESLRAVAGGSQQQRAVQLLFTRDSVYFGSDAPEEANNLYRLDRNTGEVSRLARVDGPVYHGTKVGSRLFFSTAVESQRKGAPREAVVWGSEDGKEWQPIRFFPKDPWPCKLFQHGQVMFPAGPGDGVHLWCTPVGTLHDHRTLRMTLEAD